MILQSYTCHFVLEGNVYIVTRQIRTFELRTDGKQTTKDTICIPGANQVLQPLGNPIIPDPARGFRGNAREGVLHLIQDVSLNNMFSVFLLTCAFKSRAAFARLDASGLFRRSKVRPSVSVIFL